MRMCAFVIGPVRDEAKRDGKFSRLQQALPRAPEIIAAAHLLHWHQNALDQMMRRHAVLREDLPAQLGCVVVQPERRPLFGQ